MSVIVRWDGELVAVSSIAHGGQDLGTTTLVRREKVLLPDGEVVLVPVISGNSLRGTLRRIGEELLRSELTYDRSLSLAAAHALRGGGALAKCQGPALTGPRLATLRALVPHIAIFGCAAGGTIVDGCLQVGKVVPVISELAGYGTGTFGRAAGSERERPSMFDLVQVETYARQDDAARHGFLDRCAVDGPAPAADSRQMQFGVETLIAGTRFTTWAQLNWATPLEVSFFDEVLATFAARGRLGGRVGAGHGQVAATWTRELLAGQEQQSVQWREVLAGRRDEALEALTWLT